MTVLIAASALVYPRQPKPIRTTTDRRPNIIVTHFDAIQTFFVDPEAIGNSADVSVTSVDLYFKQKPDITRNTSGSTAPGVVVSLCQVVNGTPDVTKIVADSTVRVPYELVYALSDASVPTNFAFPTPVILPSNATYGIVITFEDSGYQLWTNVQGDAIVGTNTPSSGSTNSRDGKYYLATNSGTFNALNNTDLKFRLYVAKYSGNTATLYLVNGDYEFLNISNTTGSFWGGEFVYQKEANATGTISCSAGNTTITGTNTAFTSIVDGGYIVAWNDTTTEVMQVDSVVNATSLAVVWPPSFSNATANFMVCAVGQVYYRDPILGQLFLNNSSANSTLAFDPAGVIVGEQSRANSTISSLGTYNVDQFLPEFTVESGTSAAIDTQFVLSTGNVVNTSLLATAVLNQPNYCNKYNGQLLSRSTEVALSTLYGTTSKSGLVQMQINVASNTAFSAPRVRLSEADFFVYRSKINNIYLNGSIDTEVYKNGLANSKWFSQKTAFANNRFAEDVRVYMTAYRPTGTDLRVYTKVHNSSDTETFDDKLWTPMVMIQNGNTYSSAEDRNDLVEYEFGLPQYPATDFTVNGSFTSTLSSAVIAANGFDPSANLAVGNLVKLYNPLFLENYTIGFVTAANSSTITLSQAVANNNVVGSGFKIDKLLYAGTAFLNKENGNVLRYFTLAQAPVDRFDSMQFKIVMLANNSSIVPEVDEFQAIGINAGT